MGPTASVWKLRKKRRAQLHHVRIDKVIWSAPARHAAAITAARGKTEPPPRTSVHCASSWTHIYILDIAGNPNAHHLLGVQSATTHVHESWNTPFWYVSELCP